MSRIAQAQLAVIDEGEKSVGARLGDEYSLGPFDLKSSRWTRDAYRRALALVHDDAERRLLERRLAELGTPTGLP